MPGYLGNDPAGSATKIARQTYTTSGAATTDFTFTSGYDVGYLDVYVNGERQTKGKNFTASDGSTFKVLNGGVGTGSTVEAIAYKTFNLATVDFDDLGNTGNLTLTGDISGSNATFTGDVSIGGTLTYEDVTNIDSVGVVTARAGVDIITGGIDIVGNTTGLNVSGVGTFTGDVSIADKIIHTGDTNTAIRFPAADTFTVETAGSEALRIDSSGNVGIGTDNPDSPLEVAGTGPSLVTIHHEDGGTDDEARIMLGALVGNPPDNRGAGIAAVNNGAGHDLTIKCSASHSASPTEAVRVTSAGLVGIGATAPSNILSLNDTQASGGVGIDITNQGDGGLSRTPYVFINAKLNPARPGGEIRFGREDVYGSESTADSFMAFYTAVNSTDTERLRITSAGLVGIGTTIPTSNLHVANYSGDATLEIESGVSNSSILRFGDATNNDVGQIEYDHSDNSLIFYNSNTTERLRVTGIGSVGIATATPFQSILHVCDSTSYQGIFINGSGAPRINFARAATTTVEWGVGIDGTNGNRFAIAQAGNTAKLVIDTSGNVNITGITTATQLFEGTNRVATAGKAVAMALVFG